MKKEKVSYKIIIPVQDFFHHRTMCGKGFSNANPLTAGETAVAKIQCTAGCRLRQNNGRRVSNRLPFSNYKYSDIL